MNADHYTEIGSTHLVCQDYALSGISKAGVAYAIVSDGCSSSQYSEVGAQVLCHVAKQFIEILFKSCDVVTSAMFGNLIINNASKIISWIGLPKSALDATLLIAVMRNEVTEVYAYGDGYVYLSFNKQEYHSRSFNLSYTDEAPFYLSYLLQKDRYTQYINDFKNNEYVMDVRYHHDEVIDSNRENRNPTHRFRTTANHVDLVILSSDGINSYFKDTEKIDVSKDFSGHKRTTGDFVKSNMLFHKRRMQKESIQHHDDISVAVIDCRKL